MRTIQFVDLKSQYLSMKDEIDYAIMNVVSNASFIQGPEVSKLERELEKFTGAKHSISCSSGTDALLLALMAIDIQPGDEIITTPFSFIATAEVIAFLKATPVFVDIDENTYNIDVNKIEEKITPKTRAIIPVSLYGQCSDMDEINSIAQKHNIIVIEDAAQSFGAEYKGKKSCNLSTLACTSFFPAKPLGCFGDGGAVFTKDDKIASKIRSIMNHGQTERYVHKYVGINGRLDAIQAAVLNVKLKTFSDETQKRRALADQYTKALENVNEFITPNIKSNRTSVYAQYSIRTSNREYIMKRLNEEGIPTAIHYPIPLYKQEALSYLNIDSNHFPVTEKISREIFSIPMSAFLSEEDQQYIIEKLLRIIEE